MAQIQLVDLDATPTAVVRDQVALSDLPAFFDRALPAVMSALSAGGTAPTGPPFACYHGEPTETVDLEVGFPVATPVPAAADGVTPSSLPAGRTATTVHVGPYDSLAQTYDALLAWVRDEGLRPRDVLWEVYLTDPSTEPDPATWRTQVYCPVA